MQSLKGEDPLSASSIDVVQPFDNLIKGEGPQSALSVNILCTFDSFAT